MFVSIDDYNVLIYSHLRAAKTNPSYAKLAEGTAKNAYNLTLSDWFHAPVIHEVSREADRIRVNDNVHVANVRITIVGQVGETLEQGEATLLYNPWWEFETSTEGKVIVEAFDLAGNCTKHEARSIIRISLLFKHFVNAQVIHL